MSDEVFDRAIKSLCDIDYSGELHFYGQNEPLLDKKIFSRIEQAHEVLPKAQLIMISNLTVLKGDSVERLLEMPLTRLANSVYALDRETYKKICGRDHFSVAFPNLVRLALRWADRQPFSLWLYSVDCEYNRHDYEFINHVLFNLMPCTLACRTSLIRTRNVVKKKRARWRIGKCLYNMLEVNGSGDVSICSFDHDPKLVSGNVLRDDLSAIFNSRMARRFRQEFFFGRGKERKEFCEVCDCSMNKLALLWPKFFSLLKLPGRANEYKKDVLKENSSQEIREKAKKLTELFNPHVTDYAAVLDQMRTQFQGVGM